MLTRLIYTSRALTALPLDLKDILASARKNNPPLEVTGALCFVEGVYLQYLEGDAAAVDALYKRIAGDPRHSEPHILEQSKIDARRFGNWSMGLVTWDEDTRELFRSCSTSRAPGVYKMDPTKVVTFFHALVRGKNWMSV